MTADVITEDDLVEVSRRAADAGFKVPLRITADAYKAARPVLAEVLSVAALAAAGMRYSGQSVELPISQPCGPLRLRLAPNHGLVISRAEREPFRLIPGGRA